MLPCLIWQPELLLREIYEFEHLEQLLVRALTHSKDENARKAVERTFRLICTHKMQKEMVVTTPSYLAPKVHIAKILLKNLPGQASPSEQHYEEFFNLITSIIRACGDNFVLEPNSVAAQDPIDPSLHSQQ